MLLPSVEQSEHYQMLAAKHGRLANLFIEAADTIMQLPRAYAGRPCCAATSPQGAGPAQASGASSSADAGGGWSDVLAHHPAQGAAPRQDEKKRKKRDDGDEEKKVDKKKKGKA